MLPFLRIPNTSDEDIVVVDCPSCPVNLSCLTGKSGTGWRFDCCGTAGMDIRGGQVMIDCGINQFVRDEHIALNRDKCPLCTGGIMEAVELSQRNPFALVNYYLPTVHSKFQLAERLTNLRRRRQEALAQTEETKEG